MINKRYPSLVGQRFNRLTVMSYLGSIKEQNIWECQCDCGKIIKASTHSLRCGNTGSCGCLQKEISKAIIIKASTTHGLSKDNNGKHTRLFRIWTGMKNRCYNTKTREYYMYGGRGIVICDEWLKFKVFHEWALSHGYLNNLTIERKDNDLSYSPENCEWITRGAQSYNRSTTKLVEYKGEKLPISLMAKKYGIGPVTFWSRLKNGWSIERAITAKLQVHNRLKISNN